MYPKKYHISWCPICNQGWVNIVKDYTTKEFYFYCEECESEWNILEIISPSNVLPFNSLHRYEYPTEEEVINLLSKIPIL
jgi:hypothetical protein